MIDLEEIKAREKAATAGPWNRYGWGPMHDAVTPWEGANGWIANRIARVKRAYGRIHDAEFIAHARTDIPDLIAEVERLRGILGGRSEEKAR